MRAALLLPLAASALAAQAPFYARLKAVPGADAAQVAWLEQRVPPAEAERILDLVHHLSRPEAAQVMGAWPHLDGSLPALGTELAELLEKRPAAGEAGCVEVLYRVAYVRRTLLDAWARRAPGVWAEGFKGGPLEVAEAPSSLPDLKLSLDFAPARAELELLERREQDPEAIRRALSGPVFEALMHHRSQGFYRYPLTWEGFSACLALAGSDAPAAALYREANPMGLLDLGDLRRFLPEYRALLDRLEAQQGRLAAQVKARIAPYVPAGTAFERRVSFLFCGGADGWASGEVAALDIEYFKDDLPRLQAVMAHETYHAAQHAVAKARPQPPTPALEALDDALQSLFQEGTATFVAPALDRSPEAQKAAEARGLELLDRLVDAALEAKDAARAEALRGQGTVGAGPFYWLGAGMSRTIVEAHGPAALAATLPGGWPAFLDAYDAACRDLKRPSVLPKGLRDRLRILG